MLNKEQSYVLEIAEEQGIELKILSHQRPTKSCKEKLDLLGENSQFKDWTLDRIVKALYFSRNNDPYIGVITPEFERRVEAKVIFPKVLEISRSSAERYWVDPNHVPMGMSWGTCTPFPLVSSMGKEIKDIIILDYPRINDGLVDISIGGGVEALKTSMHLPYNAIYEILRRKFGDRIHLYQSQIT